GSAVCGRITLTTKGYETLAALLEAEGSSEDAALYRPRYNIAPTDPHWIARLAGATRRLAPARWGIKRGGGPLAINARAETAARTLAAAFRDRRCLVPACGFYEWTGPPKDRRPVWFHRERGDLLLLAGLYEEHGGKITFT